MTDTIETTAVAVCEQQAVAPMSVNQLVDQVRLIQEVMRTVMKEGEHFGKIPGCGDKHALLKSGAEKLGMTFHLAPRFDVRRTDMANGHREYEVTCTLNDRYQGVGACSTMESKYRYRSENTGKEVPKAYWEARNSDLLGGSMYHPKKVDGKWLIFHKVDHDNPADYYNTVLKMAKKRAHVDAVLTATAASDIFTQDVEDLAENGVIDVEGAKPIHQSTPRAKTPPAASQTPKQAPVADPDQIAGDRRVLLEAFYKLCPKTLIPEVSKFLEGFKWTDGSDRHWLLPNETIADDLPVDKLRVLVNKWETFRDLIDAWIRDEDQIPGAEVEAP